MTEALVDLVARLDAIPRGDRFEPGPAIFGTKPISPVSEAIVLDEVTDWIEQCWQYALFAAVAIVRECAERSGTPIETFVSELAKRLTIEIS